MEREKSWEKITFLGKYMRKQWQDISKKHNILIKINGLPSISSFNFIHKDANKYKTFLTQEFLKKGYLASTYFYASMAHNRSIIDNYSKVLDEVFLEIKKCISGEKNIDLLLQGKVSHIGFKRLN